tara:strand:+ start:298 stop:1011 length:714 start_codon:yes stop_codon:yes gene_type:complete
MSKYEVKLVNIGEEVDNRIRELEKANSLLKQAFKRVKKDLNVYKNKNGELQTEVKDIRKANDNLTRANESYRQENIDLRKEQDIDGIKERNAFLEKLHNQHRYVFSEIPNNEENLKMVKLMKKHINKERYSLRWRGQYLDDKTKETEGWKPYSYGQPMNKSKCIRVYIDSKGDDTTEGFNTQEVDLIINGLKELKFNNGDCEKTLSLQKYFNSMKIHLEESKLARAEVVNQNLSASK